MPTLHQNAKAEVEPMRRLHNVAACLVSLALIACSGAPPMVLEAKDVQSFKTSVSDVRGGLRLTISGLAFHSALAVERLDQEKNSNTLHLAIILVPARPGLSGTFEYAIEVPPTVTRITFGNARTVIWQWPGR